MSDVPGESFNTVGVLRLGLLKIGDSEVAAKRQNRNAHIVQWPFCVFRGCPEHHYSQEFR